MLASCSLPLRCVVVVVPVSVGIPCLCFPAASKQAHQPFCPFCMPEDHSFSLSRTALLALLFSLMSLVSSSADWLAINPSVLLWQLFTSEQGDSAAHVSCAVAAMVVLLCPVQPVSELAPLGTRKRRISSAPRSLRRRGRRRACWPGKLPTSHPFGVLQRRKPQPAVS